MKTLQRGGSRLLILALAAIGASAQPVITAKSGTVSHHEGTVLIGDKVLEESLTKFEDVKENGVLRTEAGRAEVLLTPGVILRLGEDSSFKLLDNRLIDTRLELLTGSATIEADEIAKDTNVTVLVKDSPISVMKAGFYRFDAEPARLRVFGGSAQVHRGEQTIQVSGGKMLMLDGLNASVEKFDTADTDPLDRWSRRRNELLALANVSAAKSLRDNGTRLSAGMWRWNPYFGMITFIPASGRFCNPYWDTCFWSPVTVTRVFYVPPVQVFSPNSGFPSYGGMPATSSGYSGVAAARSSVAPISSAPAASSSGSTAASSAGTSSVGRGGAGGGGRGH